MDRETDMNIPHVLSLLSVKAIIIYQILGFYIYKIDPQAKINRLFSILCHILTAWSMAHTFLYFSHDLESYWLWTKLAAIGWCFFYPVAFQLMLLFTRSEEHVNGKIVHAIYFSAAFFYIWVAGFLGVNAPQRVEQLFIVAFKIYYMIVVGVMIVMIRNWSKQTKLHREKMQSKIIIVTGLTTLALALVTEIYFPVIVAGKAADYTHLILLILILGLWHAVRRYGLFSMASLINAEDILNRVTELIIIIDLEGSIVKVNTRFEALTGYTQEKVAGINLNAFTDKSFTDICPKDNQRVTEIALTNKWGSCIPLQVSTSYIRDKGGYLLGFVLVGQDMRLVKRLQTEIEERRCKEKELEYLSFHDPLTHLYNRTYFEREMKRLNKMRHCPLGIIIADVDGLKFANDTFGHDEGDALLLAAAGVLKDILADKGMVARIGGDEFAILMTDFNKAYINEVEARLAVALERYNRNKPLVPLSISIGIDVCYGEYKDIMELFKTADNNMYRVKLNQGQSARSTMVQALLSTLGARHVETEDHAERLRALAIELGRKTGLSKYEVTELSLLAQFHDLGKIGIADSILLKPQPLSADERREMNRHCEIGFRIAQSVPELAPIARLILAHHERWDGLGYPLGIQGEQIPLECRILAIVDAYDAMINDRPYRKAILPGEAIAELQRNASTQFDPVLVAEFADMMLSGQNVPKDANIYVV